MLNLNQFCYLILPLLCLIKINNCHEILNKWPFELADELIHKLKHNIDVLEELAVTNKFVEEHLELKEEFNEAAALEHAEVYDFIIVGGGTSGAVLANRLSEIPEWKILLLEAGGYETDATQVPQNSKLLINTPFNWGFTTTPQNYSCLAMEDHKCSILSGKVLGGTTSINSMIYTRGNSRDYDIWADLDNKGWCYADVLPYFKKIENICFKHFDEKYHHYGGLQNLEYPQYLTKMSKYLLEACNELGLKEIDYNGEHQLGVSLIQMMTKYGHRYSTSQSYLNECINRPNLVVKKYSQVIKIMLSHHTKDIKGVQYIHDGKINIVKTKKEVILAGGAINTPKLLILSGIGPKEHCDELNITHIHDLNVGKFLQTHPKFIGLDFLYNETNQLSEGIDIYHDLLKYLRDGNGQMTTTGIENIAFIHTPISKEPSKYPDIELQFRWKYYTKYDKYEYGYLDPKQYEQLLLPLIGKKGIQITVTLTHPKSYGYLKLKTKDPLNYPIIEPNLLNDHNDIKTLLSGIKYVLNLTHTETFKKFGLKLNPHQIKDCEHLLIDHEDYWECAIKYLTISNGDIWGTCKMGIDDNKQHDNIVNNKLQIHGIEHLRIIDSSIIPIPITGSLTAIQMVIAEKAADLIREYWH